MTDVINMEAIEGIKMLVGDNPEALNQLISMFFDNTPKLLLQIKNAIEANDPVGVRQAAHSLKSNAAQFGAIELEALTKDLELMGRSETIDNAYPIYLSAETAYAEAKAALEALQ